MKDRTEEIKALREFNVQHGYDASDKSWIEDAVLRLKVCTSMLSAIDQSYAAFMRTLVSFDAIELAIDGSTSPVSWMVKASSGSLYGHRVYRIAPDYQLPDLTEAVKPRYDSGTWLWSESHGYAYEVVYRTEYKGDRSMMDADWYAVLMPDGRVGQTSAILQALPPKPTLTGGWELTGKAVCCDGTQRLAEGERWVMYGGDPCNEYFVGQAAGFKSYYNQWRWIARRVEVKKDETKYCVMIDACRGSGQMPFIIPPNEGGYEVKTLGAGMVSITPWTDQ